MGFGKSTADYSFGFLRSDLHRNSSTKAPPSDANDPMDSGFGISAPPEVIDYFLSGLYLGLIPIALVALGA